MKLKLRSLGPVVLTLAVSCVAVYVLLHLWDYYTVAPWTRDGRIRADIVQVAPDVSGLITDVEVKDNQPVHRGDLLFVIDRDRYTLALQQAEATAAAQRATLAQARRENARNHQLTEVVAKEVVEAGQAKVESGEAAVAQADAAVRLAKLNLERTRVVAPADGYLNDRLPRVGDYVTTGRPVLSMVDAGSLHVEGYFEETKMRGIHIGDKVEIRLMGERHVLHGHVQSIVAGIEDRDRTSGASMLPNINPTFNWVRLAQRIPVRIALDDVPADMRLVAGRTATVTVVEGQDKAQPKHAEHAAQPDDAAPTAMAAVTRSDAPAGVRK
ncbi:efflux RND transporter periplasmic adaptor subunit [Pandoraea commovens]|uniref:Efflux RND transporter periplasmic adaptor subunit n=2 Tax=Pandoraea TaxID=93217 RepID=A0A5E4UPY9_9BURK|nr:efflux RND transporter periplasmic adaptor subunit [Pandoraea commovens]UVA78385.1 efflux RND transporter periplasmic adaptor subunit [Pandoraea commovens]VVE01089.1 efflux transporter periplasmic adaptor subunit [Pandoraea commovens]